MYKQHDTAQGGLFKRLFVQFCKFGVVGVLAFIIDYGLMLLLTQAFGVNYLISTTISFTVSVIFNYVASMRYVFTHRPGLSRRREFIIFVVLSVIGLGLNELCMWLGQGLLLIDYRITKVAATAIVMVFNFITRKIFLDDTGKSADKGGAQ
jgi:putative flippase GtrA